MLTATAFPVPYVPTTSATVTRNADSFALTGTDFTDNFNPNEGIIFLSGVAPLPTTSYPIAVQISDNSYNNRLVIYYDAATQRLYSLSNIGGVTQANLYVALNRGTAFRACFSYKAASFSLSVNGSAAVTQASGGLPTSLSRLDVGGSHVTGDASFNSYLDRVFYKPKSAISGDVQKMAA